MFKKIKTIKKQYLILIGIVIFILIIVVIKKTKPIAYSDFVVEKTDVTDTLVLAGVIDVENRVELGFAESGRVDKILKETGDDVKKGDVIAVLSQNRLQADLIEAQANYTVTRVNSSSDEIEARSHLEKTIVEQDTIVENLYQEYLATDLQAYLKNKTQIEIEPPTITGNYIAKEEGEYLINVDAAGNSYELYGIERGDSLVKENQPTKLGTNGLYIQFDADSFYNNTNWVIPIPNDRSETYLSRKKAYETAVATRNRLVRDAQNELDRAVGTDKDSSLSRAEAQRQQAQAQVQAVYSQLGDGRITAPFDGIVAKNDLELGEIVSAYSPLITVVNSLEKELVLNVPEIYINKVQIEDEVDIILDAYKDIVFRGTITHIDIIDTLVDGVPVYQTTVKLNESDERIRIGMNARAYIVTEERQSVLALPAHFIQFDESGAFVQTKETERQNIEIGLQGSNGMTEILSGLEIGDTVLIETE